MKEMFWHWLSDDYRFPKRPKRPMSAFLCYCADHRELKKKQYPDISSTDISRLLCEDWRGLSNEERTPYYIRCHKDGLRYKASFVDYCSSENEWDSLKSWVFQLIESMQRVELDDSVNDNEIKRQICQSLACGLRNSIRCGQLESCNLLLDKFKNHHFIRLPLQEPQNGLFPLKEAARKGHIAVVQRLLYDHKILDLYPDIIINDDDNKKPPSSQKAFSQDIVPIVWLCTEKDIANLDVIFSCIRRQPSDFINVINTNNNDRRGGAGEKESDVMSDANSIGDSPLSNKKQKIEKSL